MFLHGSPPFCEAGISSQSDSYTFTRRRCTLIVGNDEKITTVADSKHSSILRNSQYLSVMSDGNKTYRCGLIWFRNDLRLSDHEALFRASEACETVVCLYFIPVALQGMGYGGLPRFSRLRARFLKESLTDLAGGLSELGAGLYVTDSGFSETLEALFREHRVDALFFHDEPGDEEAREAEICLSVASRFGIEVHQFFGASLHHPDDVPFEIADTPDVFTSFRTNVEKTGNIRPPFPKPVYLKSPLQVRHDSFTLPSWLSECAGKAETSEHTAFPFVGGENAALKRLKSYFWETRGIERYKETRNGLVGTEYSSKLSPWLAVGCISPRAVFAELLQYEQQRVRNESTYWLIFELRWRDFYMFQMLKHGKRSFNLHGPFNKARSWGEDEKGLEAWKCGRTGVPFVDAGMREVTATGYMSNRSRQNCASFLSNNLNIDWRLGAQWFEAHLLDYDVSSNWGNWAYNSRVGCDPRDRFFDVVGQGERYDRNAEYISLWVPELKRLSTEAMHRPWKNSVDAGRYPRPVVDLEASYTRLYRESRKS
ncbi:MAG: DASH family cryptochrome [Spirochaetaceae bacterium]|nr:MAG: DASH family cryptochrome [Spirochaetaceae bacterium]